MALYSLSPNTRIESAKLNANFEGLANGTLLEAGAITSTNIDFGGAGAGIWWQEIARTTLGVAGDTITVSSIPARKYLRILIYAFTSGGTGDANMIFNGDTGANYTGRYVTTGAFGSAISGNFVALDSGDWVSGGVLLWEGTVVNVSTAQKAIVFNGLSIEATGVATAPNQLTGAYYWNNTSAQISSLTVTNLGTGDLVIGSEVIVLGHD